MPFVSTPERVGLREGMKEGIEPALKIKFGDAALKLMPEIDNIHELAQLRRYSNLWKWLQIPTTFDVSGHRPCREFGY